MTPGRDPFGPQGRDWQDFCREPQTLLHTKYISCGPRGFREDEVFPIISLGNLYMGVTDILTYEPRPFKQVFNPTLIEGST